jgi:hypothetical protein
MGALDMAEIYDLQRGTEKRELGTGNREQERSIGNLRILRFAGMNGRLSRSTKPRRYGWSDVGMKVMQRKYEGPEAKATMILLVYAG